jgi:hypothetical protein
MRVQPCGALQWRLVCCWALLSITSDAARAQSQSVGEGTSFRLSAPSAVWYGAGAKFTVKSLPAGTYVCGNAVFGDPNDGVVKSCKGTAFLDAFTCYPAQLNGSGSRAAWGVTLAPVAQAWAGWWCGNRMQVLACLADGCKPDVAKGVMASVSDIMNPQIKAFRTETVDSDRLKAVWVPHLAEINAMKLP